MLRTMISACLLPLLAIVISAQQQAPASTYSITDVVGNEGTQDPNTVPAPTAFQQPVAAPGSQTGPVVVAQPAVAQQGWHPRPNGAPAVGGAANGMNVMASLLKGITGGGGASPLGMSGGFQPGGAPQALNGASLGGESTEVVSGLIEAFMHKVNLEGNEKACLVSNVGSLTGGIMGVVMDVVTAIKALVQGKGTVQRQQSGGVVQAGIDAAMKLTTLVASSTSLVKGCVHGDALTFLNMTAQHLINGSYLEHNFIVNGVDIAHFLSDSIVAFERQDFHRFGVDIGTALRKVLLSTRSSTNATRLPEGVPDEVIIQKATDGIMRGFFVEGSGVVITDTVHPDVDIEIDLHQCIAENSALWKELWLASWDLIAQISVNAEQHDLGAMFVPHKGGKQPKWAGELMIAMMQFPMALSRCGVRQDMQHMFLEAIKTLNDVKVQFKFPQDQVTGQGTTDRMAKAVEAWTNWDFEDFGYELGMLFRELIMLAFPMKYSVVGGRLQLAAPPSSSTSGSVVIVGGAAVSVLMALAVVRTRRSSSKTYLQAEVLTDVEDGSTDLLVE